MILAWASSFNYGQIIGQSVLPWRGLTLSDRPIRVAVFVVDVFYVLLYPTRLAVWFFFVVDETRRKNSPSIFCWMTLTSDLFDEKTSTTKTATRMGLILMFYRAERVAMEGVDVVIIFYRAERVAMEGVDIVLMFYRAERVAMEGVDIDGLVIPENLTVGIPIYALHHSEEHWKQPEKYRPERSESFLTLKALK